MNPVIDRGSQPMHPIIELQDVRFRYPRANHDALRGVSFSVPPGAFLGITGPTGAGKTTLCHCLNGLVPHHTGGELLGMVAIDGMDAPTFSPAELARTVGSVFQDPDGQLVAETVEEEIVFGMENMGLTRSEMEERLVEVLALVGLESQRYEQNRILSGGQKQRLAIAAALAMAPKILVLDEPTSELDPKGTHDVYQALKMLSRRGITILIVDHKVQVMAEYVHDMLVIAGGEIVAHGPTHQVLRQDLSQYGVANPAVSKFGRQLIARNLWLGDVPVTMEEGLGVLEALRGQTASGMGQQGMNGG
ncbi:MAG: ABC transporter ATP-binding protein [Firmicutes bacterium]|nr:ABC transporter ATP-binding protein [Bacillota bacterium]